MVVKGNFTSRRVLNKKFKVCLGWDGMEVPPPVMVVSFKRLRDEGLHIFEGMVEYCTKDNKEEYFEFVHHNVLANA